MTVDQMTKQLEPFIAHLTAMCKREGLPLEGEFVRGHNVMSLFSSAISGRYYKRFCAGDFTLVANFLDDNWERLQKPYVPVVFKKVVKTRLVPQQPMYQWIQFDPGTGPQRVLVDE